MSSDLPSFDIKPEQIEPEVTSLLEKNLADIEALLAQEGEYTWESLIAPIESLDDKLSQMWSPVNHLNSVCNTPNLRQAHQACLQKISDYSSKIGQNHQLYEAFQSIKDSSGFGHFNKAQQKVITDQLRDFTLSGVALPLEKRQAFSENKQKLSKLQSQFSNNVLDATDAWFLDVTDQKMLKGVPEHAMRAAKEKAMEANVAGWRFGLDAPSYMAIIQHAENRNLREKMYTAYTTRASDQGPFAGKWDNTTIIDEILALRHQQAKLLGFPNYAAVSLVPKMAKTEEEVLTFLEALVEKARPIAIKEYEALKVFAAKKGLQDLQPWDLPYFSEKLREEKYAISQESLRPYFPLPKVLSGMFEIVGKLYGLRVEKVSTFPSYHKEVAFFAIYDRDNNLRGQFYLDCFARAKKRGGAWMDEARVRRKLFNGGLQTPIAYLACNFTPPVGDSPVLLTHEEVLILFHEFGHGLHHMLTQVDYAPVSGINGVPWDAVELPSQFMENFCWQKEGLALISSHIETNEPLPDRMLEKLRQSKNFHSALQLIRQLEFAIFDFTLHSKYQPGKTNVQAVLDNVRQTVSVVPVPSFSRFQNGFSHIFAGGYAAGYYSYLWAEVLAQDAFAKFEETGIFNKKTGQEFLQHILEQGGSREPDELFLAFRGRPAKIEPLLRSRGLL